MAEKKLFPGVTEQDIQKQEQEKLKAAQEAETKRIALQQAKEKAETDAKVKEEQKQFDDTVKDFYKKFSNRVEDLKGDLRKFLFGQLAFLGVMHGIWLFGHIEPGKDAYGDDKGINFFELALSTSDADAAEKTHEKTGSETLSVARYFVNPTLETYNLSNIFKKESYNIKGRDMSLIRAYAGLIAIIIGAAITISESKKRTKIKDIRKLLLLWQKNNIADIKMQEFINQDMVGKIISHMSGQDAKVFNQMLKGEITVSYETAVKIMEGHLQKHPEDVQMIFDFFDERSIPESIKQMANKPITQGR